MEVGLQNFFDAADEVVGIEGDFGQEHDVRRRAAVVGILSGVLGVVALVLALSKDGGGGEPTRITTHDFKDGNEVVAAHGSVIERHFAYGQGDVLGDGAVTWAVVGEGQIVVDRLRHADDAEFITALLSEGIDLRRGVLGVVATDVVEVTDVVRFEDLEDAVKVFLLLNLVAAGPEGSTRGVLEVTQGLLGLFGEVNQLLV